MLLKAFGQGRQCPLNQIGNEVIIRWEKRVGLLS